MKMIAMELLEAIFISSQIFMIIENFNPEELATNTGYGYLWGDHHTPF